MKSPLSSADFTIYTPGIGTIDYRLPKSLFYGELSAGKRSVGPGVIVGNPIKYEKLRFTNWR